MFPDELLCINQYKHIKSQVKSNSPFITRRLSFEEDEKINQVERSGKVNIRQAEVLAVGEVGKAIVSPTPTLNIEPFDSFEFSAKGTVIYVLIVS